MAKDNMTTEVRRSSSAMLGVAILLTLMLGVLDWASGYALQFFLFYFLPVALTAWWCGPSRCYGVAVLCTVVWYTADGLAGNPLSFTAYALWNTLIRLVTFLIIAFTVAKIRLLLSQEQKISQELRAAMAEIKTLSGLLPICARCKNIRDVKGYWHQIETYIARHSTVQFTHGLCEHCLRLTLKEGGLDDDPVAPAAAARFGTSTGPSPAGP